VSEKIKIIVKAKPETNKNVQKNLEIILPDNNSEIYDDSRITVKVDTKGEQTIEKIEYYLGDQKLGEKYGKTLDFNLEKLPVGEHNLLVKAYDNKQLVAQKSIEIKVKKREEKNLIKPIIEVNFINLKRLSEDNAELFFEFYHESDINNFIADINISKSGKTFFRAEQVLRNIEKNKKTIVKFSEIWKKPEWGDYNVSLKITSIEKNVEYTTIESFLTVKKYGDDNKIENKQEYDSLVGFAGFVGVILLIVVLVIVASIIVSKNSTA
jgi:hypothetical protein